ncbi:hypothetical protein STAS_27328, partial [Striga asiatica]
ISVSRISLSHSHNRTIPTHSVTRASLSQSLSPAVRRLEPLDTVHTREVRHSLFFAPRPLDSSPPKSDPKAPAAPRLASTTRLTSEAPTQRLDAPPPPRLPAFDSTPISDMVETLNIRFLHIASFMMNILHSTSPFIPPNQSAPLPQPLVKSPSLHTFVCRSKSHLSISSSIKFPHTSSKSSRALQFSIDSTVPSSYPVTDFVVHFEDFVEKDWSFLDPDETKADQEHMKKIDRIISAGKIEETSRVLVSVGSEAFVDRVVCSSPCEQLFVIHDSLLTLACIKEKYDEVKCWQGELVNPPEKWTNFDVVFLYFLPALPFELDQVLAALAGRCLPGARVVISHQQGRQVAEDQQKQYPDIVVSSLPEKMTLHNAAAKRSFEVVEFMDEPDFYLAVLRYNVALDK